MALSDEQKAKVENWRRSKDAEKCAACGFDGMMLYGDVAILPRASEVGLAGDGFGIIPIACSTCGHVMLFEEQAIL